MSPFHWPQNTWPWMTSNGRFTLNFHYYEQPFGNLFYILTVELKLYHVTTEMCGSGPWSAEYLGSAEKLRIFRRRYIVGTLTHKANSIIIVVLSVLSDHTSTDSKTRDLEWRRMATALCFAPICLELWSLAFDAVLTLIPNILRITVRFRTYPLVEWYHVI